MSATPKKIIAKEFCHSNKFRTPDGNAVSISERLYLEDGSVVPNLRIIDNPKRSFYVTKPEFQTNADKIEFIEISKTDRYITTDAEMDDNAFKTLYGYPARNGFDFRKLRNHPHLYGYDIDIQTLLKNQAIKEFDKSGVKPQPMTNGMLDGEWDIDTGEVSAFTYCHENIIFVAYLKKLAKFTEKELEDSFYRVIDPVVEEDVNKVDPKGRSIQFRFNSISDRWVKQFTKKKLEEHPERKDLKIPFIPVIKACDSELEIVQWIFSMIHRCKTTFIGAWSLDADIPKIFEVLEKNNVDPADVFCPPEVKSKYRNVFYKKDMTTREKKNSHIVDYWDWLSATSYSQFYDAMALYGRLRKHKEKEASYALDYILQKVGFGGKLKFKHIDALANLSNQDWHRKMTSEFFLEYVLYNVVDVIKIMLMEWHSSDVDSMCLLAGASSLLKFPRETVKFSDACHCMWFEKGYVLSGTKNDMSTQWDKYLPAFGGAVLDPNRILPVGLKPFKDLTDRITKVHTNVNDIDFSAMYPTVIICCNISRATKRFTALRIIGDHLDIHGNEAVEQFFTAFINRGDEGVRMGVTFFNMPNFEEMETLFEEELKGEETKLAA